MLFSKKKSYTADRSYSYTIYSIFAFSLTLALFGMIFEHTIILKPVCSQPYKIHRIISEYHQTEIPMFGSSRIEENIDPQILGNRYFNYGLSAIQGNIILFFISEEVKKNKKTPIIINFDYSGDFLSSGDIDYYLYDIDYTPIKNIIKNKDRFYYHIPFIKYYGLYEFYLRNFIGRQFGSVRYHYQGAAIYKQSISASEFNEDVVQRKNAKYNPTHYEIYFKRLSSIIKSYPERKFIFLVAPYHESFFSGFKEESKAILFLNSLKINKNVKILNFSKTHFSQDYFYDTLHLNYKGAVKYTQMVRDSLRTVIVRE